MIFTYRIAYIDATDDFYGVVDGDVDGVAVLAFEINDTQEMCDLIKTGVMKHIDDVKGLEGFLKRQNAIAEDDSLVMSPRTLW